MDSRDDGRVVRQTDAWGEFKRDRDTNEGS
jgi:hypothetical protein